MSSINQAQGVIPMPKVFTVDPRLKRGFRVNIGGEPWKVTACKDCLIEGATHRKMTLRNDKTKKTAHIFTKDAQPVVKPEEIFTV